VPRGKQFWVELVVEGSVFTIQGAVSGPKVKQIHRSEMAGFLAKDLDDDEMSDLSGI